jgi:CheY-like chemotaxis protein
LRLDAPDTLPQLFMDRTRIRQVLLNLLNNAVRFTDEGGITVLVEQSDRSVEVHVSDTGVGIPPNQLAHIFEAFHQVQAGPRGRGGTGLGLALSRQFVELHGGRMWAESVMGQGSVFHFSLPLPGAAPETSPLYQVPYRKQAERGDVPVIVVDPDPSIADMLSRYLGDRRVLIARDVAEAEALIESEHPLGVIVNQMPDRPPEEWVGALGQVSARYDVPILRCAIPSPSWLRQTAGLDGCVTKPVTREALADVFNASSELPRSILIVDDDAGFVNLMCRMLATLPMMAEVKQFRAYTGAQAVRLAREKKPDLVFLDLLMPEMDGFEVLQAIREDPTLGGTRVVAVTATSYGEEALRRRGGYFTLSQPMGVSTGTLTELLNAVLSIVRPQYVLDQREDG